MEEINNKKETHKTIAYKFGQLVGGVILLCATSIIVTITIKIILWILGM